jgi:Ni2+-binding GTPase involved in maturation of urease and hydrogenase
MDLAEAVEFDSAAAACDIQPVRPGMTLLKVSLKNGAGMDDWLRYLAHGRHDPTARAL